MSWLNERHRHYYCKRLNTMFIERTHTKRDLKVSWIVLLRLLEDFRNLSGKLEAIFRKIKSFKHLYLANGERTQIAELFGDFFLLCGCKKPI